MTYDGYGNILTKNGKQYTYGDGVWKDQLTGFDGKTITYNAQGNPTNYLGYELTWEKGRQLKSFGTNAYTYNANGIRTSKTVNGEKHTYFLEGTTILQERWGENTLEATLDNEGQLCGIVYNKTPYFFLKNLQGDVIAICNEKGEAVARYSYDAWGKCTIVEDTTDFGLATINPYRYRGYYYDTETGLYYLQSRYYDPKIGRFINGDAPEVLGISIAILQLLGVNLLTYCSNDPVNDVDSTGRISTKQLAALLVPASVFAMFTVALTANFSKGLVAVGAYATKIITPVAIKAFWWKPIAAAAIIIAAVAIVLLAVTVLYNTSKAKKKGKTKLPSKLKIGNKVKTPNSHSGEFKKNRGGSYTHNKTKWRYEKSKDGHYRGEHWHAYPENGQTGDYYNISPDGRVLG